MPSWELGVLPWKASPCWRLEKGHLGVGLECQIQELQHSCDHALPKALSSGRLCGAP